jgi:hypothetical protein
MRPFVAFVLLVMLLTIASYVDAKAIQDDHDLIIMVDKPSIMPIQEARHNDLPQYTQERSRGSVLPHC